RGARPASCHELIALVPEPGPSASPRASGKKALAPGRAPEPDGRAERRRAVRYPARRAASCRPVRSGLARRWAVEVLDVSKSGVQVKLDRRFEAGTVLELVVFE